ETTRSVDGVDDPQALGVRGAPCDRGRGLLGAIAVAGEMLLQMLQDDFLRALVGRGGDFRRGVGNRLKACVFVEKGFGGQFHGRESDILFVRHVIPYIGPLTSTGAGPIGSPANSLNSRYCRWR